MSSIPCDIALLPDDALSDKAIALSKQLQSEGTLFTLTRDSNFPHASIYMTQLKESDLSHAKELLAGIAKSTAIFRLTSKGYYQAEGYLDADYARTEDLDAFQMKVIDAINPIRDGMREKDKARMLEATGKVRESLEKYGYRGVGELFRPHMTFTRFQDGQIRDVRQLPAPDNYSGTFVKLGLFEMGDNGTCKRKIAEFDLGGRT